MLLLFALLNSLEDRLFVKGQRATVVLGTQLMHGTRLAIFGPEMDAYQFMITAVFACRPRITGMALWTNRDMVLPINAEGIDFIACCLLPRVFFDDGAEQFNAVVGSTVNEVRARGVARINKVFGRHTVACF